MWPRLADELLSWLADLRGLRRTLLTLAILFFTIMLLEVDLGHRPALARQDSWLALVPVVWLPISLVILMTVQIVPSFATALIAMAVMAITAAVGMAGSGLHMMAAGVDLGHLSRVFSSAVWGGHESPNWPVAITLAAVLGFIASIGSQRSDDGLPCDIAGMMSALAYALIVAGIAFSALPSLVMISAACLLSAALLLLAVLIAMLTSAAIERSAS
jgi:hypothetical protein